MRGRFLWIAPLALGLLAGCQAEPGFDEKFEQRSGELSAKARQIEADAKVQLDAAREAEQASAEAYGALPPPSDPAATSSPDPSASTR